MRDAIYLLVAANIVLAFASHLSLPLLTLFPMENMPALRFADASWVYGGYGTVASIMSIAASRALDRLPALGVSFVGVAGACAVRVVLPSAAQLANDALEGSPAYYALHGLALFLLCFVMPVFDVLTMMPLSLALKRFVATERAGDEAAAAARLRSLITFVYAISNGTDVVANVLYDGARHAFSAPAANAASSWVAGGVVLAAVPLLWQVRVRGGRADRAMPDHRQRTCDITCASPRFWRFMVLVTLLVGVRMLFRHLDLTLAVYLLRASGQASHFALIQSINPFVVVCLGSLLSWHISKGASRFLATLFRDDYTVLQVGTAISATAPLLLGALSLSSSPLLSAEATAALSVFVFSLGEIVWSPRFIAYALDIAPEGSEAVYMALAALPSLAAKPLTSALSTLLVDSFCPTAGDAASCNGAWLWTSIGLIAATTPLGLVAFERWLREAPPSERTHDSERGRKEEEGW